MASFSEQKARDYVATGEPFGKAGAFAIQGEGRRLIESVEGSVTNVIGLPRRVVLRVLARAGYRTVQ